MQPHILFPILIFAFGMGAFLTTFVGDVNGEDSSNIEITENSTFFTKEDALKKDLENSKNIEKSKRKEWLHKFQESKVYEYHYPVTEVSIRLPLNKPDNRKIYSLTTEYLEPYQNFCINQILNKTKNVRYKIVENGNKIKFKISSVNKNNIDFILKEFKYYDIKSITNNR